MNGGQEQDLKQEAEDQACSPSEEPQTKDEANADKGSDETSQDAGAEAGAEKKEDSADAAESDSDKDSDQGKESTEEDQNDKYVRLMADFQNYKRRVEKEKSEIYDYANEKILSELLTVLDNFERALAQECADEAFGKGMEMIFKQFREVLEKSGLEEIEAQGKDFDPNFHHAVMNDSNEDYASGQVTGVLQKGYTLHGKVVRPAMVKVNQ